MRTFLMIITAVTSILLVLWLGQFGDWTVLLISIFLIIALIQAIDKSSREWKYWFGFVLLVSYLLSFSGLRVRKTEEGCIQIVKAVYPICPKVFIEGNSVDTLELATGYSTFADWYYTVQKSEYYVIKDSNELSTICSFRPFRRILQGRKLTIEEFEGEHGVINVFSYIDDAGKRIRRDIHGQNPDDESYSVAVMDNADYIPDYIP